MKKKITVLLLILFSILSSQLPAQQLELYKQIDTTKLYMEVYMPDSLDSSKSYAAMIFFFGGGWNSGSRSQFMHHANYFSKRGIVCFLADYRTKRNNTTPFESLKDAKSAIRYIRANAERFNVDKNKIIAAGGSAGGHLAAGTALVDGYNEITDDPLLSCVPDALVLFNPVIDNGPGGYGYERIGKEYKAFSPLHNIQKGAPPTILFLGSTDNLVPVQTAEYYKLVMEKVGSRCDLIVYEGQPHGFFNYSNFDYYKQTLTEADNFLVSLGLLKEHPKIKID
jgi:acetyl esterase